MMTKRLSVSQVADLWCCSKQHVYNLVARGDLGSIRVGSLLRFRPCDVEAYEEAQCRAQRPSDEGQGLAP